MNKDELIERYKGIKLKHRLLIVAALGMAYPAYEWYDKSDAMLLALEGSRNAREDSRQKNQTFKSKVTGLPAMEEKLAAVRGKLEAAKKLLPEKVEVDKLLTKIGNFEKGIGVVMVSFEPRPQVRPDPTMQYAEIPIEMTVKGHFAKIMTLFDELVHFDELTHLRNVSLVANDVERALAGGKGQKDSKLKDDGIEVTAKATLIAFKNTVQ